MAEIPTCGKCKFRFVIPHNMSTYQCRKNPPVPFLIPDTRGQPTVICAFPTMQKMDGCWGGEIDPDAEKVEANQDSPLLQGIDWTMVGTESSNSN